MAKAAKLEKLSEVMYNMFLDGTLPHLDMDDFRVMWEALIAEWGMKLPSTWEEFLEEINSKQSNKYDSFKTVFYNHFK